MMRLDKCGRDVTDLPGLWDETDTIFNGTERKEEGMMSANESFNGKEIIDILHTITSLANETGKPTTSNICKQAATMIGEFRKAVTMLETTIDGDQPACQWWIDTIANFRQLVGPKGPEEI